jgi:rRNA maturation endonuclease Nob1
MLHNAAFADKLRMVQGQWLDVDTEHLFSDQFNTVAVEGVSENGLRVMQSDVVAIVNDVRNNVVKCQWCYGYDTDNDGKCDRCGKDDYLAPLMP